jgi:hypothetical protein
MPSCLVLQSDFANCQAFHSPYENKFPDFPDQFC